MVISSLSVLPHGALLLDVAQHIHGREETRAATGQAVAAFVTQVHACCRKIFTPPRGGRRSDGSGSGKEGVGGG